MNTLVFILCAMQDLQPFLDEMKNWEEEGARMLWPGTTDKARQGYLFIAWDGSLPQAFQNKLQSDSSILDCFTVTADFTWPDGESDTTSPT